MSGSLSNEISQDFLAIVISDKTVMVTYQYGRFVVMSIHQAPNLAFYGTFTVV